MSASASTCALYDCDHTKAAERRQHAARGFYNRTQASEWHWQMYGPVEPPSTLVTTLRNARLVGPGTGAT